MKTTVFTIGDADYNIVLRTRDIIQLEKRLGYNPLMLLFKIESDNELPHITDALTVLYCALQKEHGKKYKNLDTVYNLYDEFVEAGNSYTDLLGIIVELFKDSGLIPEEAETADEPKN